MDDQSRFIKHPDVIIREEGDGAFLFDTKTGSLKYMNETAKLTFHLLEKEMGFKQVIDEIINSYTDVQPDAVVNHVEGFINHLVENQFIRIIEDNPVKKTNE
jgi:hypothetical protein